MPPVHPPSPPDPAGRNIAPRVAADAGDPPLVRAFARQVAVITLPAWLMLATIAALVAGAITWSFAGTLPTKIAGNCILMDTGGVAEIASPGTGRLNDILVQPGDLVRAGQTIGSVAQPDLDERIRRARARLGELEARAGEIATLSKRGLALNDDVLAQRRDFLTRQFELARARVRIAEEHDATQKQLLTQGLVTHRSVEDAGREVRAAILAASDLERQIAELPRGRTDVLKREADERAGVQLEFTEARRELAFLEGERERGTSIISPYEGKVIEVKAGRGMLVQKDAPVLALERSAGAAASRLEAVMYVASSEGKKILPGAEVHLSPATVRREEHGHVIGRVRFVSDYPSTPQSLLATLGNEELARDLAGVAAPFELRIEMPTDASGGHRWSRGGNPPALRAGTLCAGQVMIRRERPIGFVIPALRHESR